MYCACMQNMNDEWKLKPLFLYGRNCRERVVTVVRVVFATKWKHEEKSCRDTLATVHDSNKSNNSVVEIGSSSISTTVATG